MEFLHINRMQQVNPELRRLQGLSISNNLVVMKERLVNRIGKKIFQNVGQVEAHEVTCAFYLKYVRGHKCLICNISCKTPRSAKTHALYVHEDLYNSFIYGVTLPDKVENVGSKQESEDTKNERENLNENVEFFDCNECPQSFELEFELAMHSKKHHCDNATPLKKIQIGESFSLSHIKYELEDEEVDLDLCAATTVEPIICQSESVPQPTLGIETLDLEVTKLYKCPICQSKWLHYKKAQNHIANFHRIPIELQSQFGITIDEIIV
mgnify:CR=1 FL=1